MLALGLGLATTTSGCASSRAALATAQTDLGLTRVVLYRNGIGYFERSGAVDGDALRIKVRRDQVDDLLKSLTVIDRGSGKALSVSMPLDPETWANAALARLGPGEGDLAKVLDGLRGTEVVLRTKRGRVPGRIVMVETVAGRPPANPSDGDASRGTEDDARVTVLDGDTLRTVLLSDIEDITLVDGDLAMQLHRRLDASAGEGMFQQIEVEVRLAGARRHALVLSYVVAAPMWKPTYRVVLPERGRGQALLQAWAVVDNTSGEDWRDVTMSLTSGEPIAFEYDLHTPRTVDRADLTETAVRRQARVALGETSFAEEETIAPPPVMADGGYDAAPEAEFAEEMRAEKSMGAGGSAAPRRMAAKPSMPGMAPSPPPAPQPSAPAEPAVDLDALRRSTQANARAQTVSGMTRYDLQERVSLPNGSATMVAIINTEVEAEETFLFRPGGAGVGYDANPYRVVRFKNTTPFVLEPGPISIYAGGSFVGEGLSETVGTRTSATIPFAVEPAILVTSSSRHSGRDLRLVRVVRGVLEVETYNRVETTWTVRGRSEDEPYTVLVRHPKAGSDYALVERPSGTEDLLDAYLVPVTVPAKSLEASLQVIEQTPGRTTLSIWDGQAPFLLEKLLLGGELTAELRTQLQPIVDLRMEIGRIDTEAEGLRAQQVELDRRAEETRRNLEAIKKDPAASALRSKLNQRLAEFTQQGDALGRRLVELQSRRLEKKIELEDRLQTLDVRAPATTDP